MPTLRIEKNRNYTVMSNYHLRDKRLKLKTIGLMSLMLSLPEDWDFSVKGLSTICNDGRTAIEAALKELEVYGYLSRYYTRAENGAWADIEYLLREYPIAENPISADLHQINKDKQNKDNTPYYEPVENRKPDSGETLRDPAYAEVSAEYQKLLHFQPMGIASMILDEGIKECCKEAVLYAIEETAKHGITKTPYNYINKIIHSMIAAGVTTPEGVEAYKAAHEPTQKKNTNGAVDWDALEAKLTKEHGDGV